MTNRVHSPLAEAVGARVRARRHELSLTLQEVADREAFRIDFVGRVERGEQNLSLTTLARLALALECGIETFVGGLDLSSLAAGEGLPRVPGRRSAGAAARGSAQAKA